MTKFISGTGYKSVDCKIELCSRLWAELQKGEVILGVEAFHGAKEKEEQREKEEDTNRKTVPHTANAYTIPLTINFDQCSFRLFCWIEILFSQTHTD